MRALEAGVDLDLGFDFADDGQVAVDFGDDSGLLCGRGKSTPTDLTKLKFKLG